MRAKVILILTFFSQFSYAEVTNSDVQDSPGYTNTNNVVSRLPLVRFIDRNGINHRENLEYCTFSTNSNSPSTLFIGIKEKGRQELDPFSGWGTSVEIPASISDNYSRTEIYSNSPYEGNFEIKTSFTNNTLTIETRGYGTNLLGQIVYIISKKQIRYAADGSQRIEEASYLERHSSSPNKTSLIVTDVLCAKGDNPPTS